MTVTSYSGGEICSFRSLHIFFAFISDITNLAERLWMHHCKLSPRTLIVKSTNCLLWYIRMACIRQEMRFALRATWPQSGLSRILSLSQAIIHPPRECGRSAYQHTLNESLSLFKTRVRKKITEHKRRLPTELNSYSWVGNSLQFNHIVRNLAKAEYSRVQSY